MTAPKPFSTTLRLPNGGTETLPLMALPGGVFTMGRDIGNEKPAHRARVDGFAVMTTEVTRALYVALTGRKAPGRGPMDGPVSKVSWVDAVEFCNKLSAASGLAAAYEVIRKGDEVTEVIWTPDTDGFRLPTEAEFEYALRGGTTTPHFWGDENASDYAVFGLDYSKESPRPVKSKKPNPFGLYDMAGNVWEWTWDKYERYSVEGVPADRRVISLTIQARTVDDLNACDAAYRVLRGGAFYGPAELLRSAHRLRFRPRLRDADVGFRCVRSPLPSMP